VILWFTACAPPAPGGADEIDAARPLVLAAKQAGAHAVEVRRTGAGTELLLNGEPLLDGRWNPDRPAVAPDGTVAFVSGVTGLAAVWVVAPGAAPMQLTNVGLERSKRAPGHPPPGFVPPPIDDSLSFSADGGTLTWNGPDGRHAVSR
jgi:hypothetical protein